MADAAVVWAPAMLLNVKGKLGINSFSTPPTIAEINASSDWYQIVALYNRRVSQIYETPSYFALSSGAVLGTPTAASINDLRDKINAMRVDTGLTEYNFGADAAYAIKAVHLTDLRTALAAVSSVAVYHPFDSYSHARRVVASTGAFYNEINIASSGSPVGVDTFLFSTGVPVPFFLRENIRFGAAFLFPAFSSPLISTATAKFRVQSTGTVAGSPVIKLFTSNSDDHGGMSGWWNNVNNLIDSVANTSGSHTYDLSFSLADILAKSGDYLSIVLAESAELAGGTSNVETGFLSLPGMRVDFGF